MEFFFNGGEKGGCNLLTIHNEVIVWKYNFLRNAVDLKHARSRLLQSQSGALIFAPLASALIGTTAPLKHCD